MRRLLFNVSRPLSSLQYRRVKTLSIYRSHAAPHLISTAALLVAHLTYGQQTIAQSLAQLKALPACAVSRIH